MKKKTNVILRPKLDKLGSNETGWEELDCSKKLLILLKQGYTLQYAGKGAFVAIKGDKRFFVRENLDKASESNKEKAVAKKEASNEENK